MIYGVAYLSLFSYIIYLLLHHHGKKDTWINIWNDVEYTQNEIYYFDKSKLLASNTRN